VIVMRELVFKNLFSPASKKRDICVEETVRNSGFISKTVKRSTYFVRNVSHVASKAEFDKWLIEKKLNPALNKKRFHIMRHHSDREKKDLVYCKARGNFYAVVGKDIYNIVFVHFLKLETESVPKGG